MKHAIYILLAALALLLASCKKHHDDIPAVLVEGGWRAIGMTGFAIIWYPDSISFKQRLLFDNNKQYTEYNQDTVLARGTYELMIVNDYSTHKKVRGIRFSGDNASYTLRMQHDTLVIANNDGILCGYERYYLKLPTK